MYPTNIISAYQGVIALSDKTVETDKKLDLGLRPAEAQTLAKFYEAIKEYTEEFNILDGYYIGYTIKQISKEFDLLRFSSDTVINIELKAHLDEDIKIKKITEQMQKNHYYLKFLGKAVLIYTYVEDDGIYKYDIENNKCEKSSFTELTAALAEQMADDHINPDRLFVPSNYLISPFNHTDKFINSEYFLTNAQNDIKKQIIKAIYGSNFEYFCISANAGTGKTLMLYDITKTVIAEYGASSVLLIHCGKLNDGHLELKNHYKWNIASIADITDRSVTSFVTENLKVILIDESQRIRSSQLEMIIKASINFNIPIVFAYDKKQFLKENETLDLFEYIKEYFAEISVTKRELTNKIRTNKEMASFITNLLKIGRSNKYLNYDAVTIEYFDTLNDVKAYIDYLETSKGFKAIKYTPSRYTMTSFDRFTSMCSSNAHDVIGQEFEKVVFVMDKNFWYNESNDLCARGSYYSAIGMLYQIVTRVVSELKIVVLNNPNLYCRLLEIKAMDKDDD